LTHFEDSYLKRRRRKRKRRRRGGGEGKNKFKNVKCGNNMVWSELAQDEVQRWENKLCTRKQMDFLTQLHFYHEVGCISCYILSV
jgi:hypothetical protein